jgi:hypothetical protein
MEVYMRDLFDCLPNGKEFISWETETNYHHQIHVSANHPDASDENDGSAESPFVSINAAAAIATPGTCVLIHGGEYRECVRPAKGGDGPDKMIAYEAFGDGEVIIKASEIVEGFEKSTGWRKSPGFGKFENEDILIDEEWFFVTVNHFIKFHYIINFLSMKDPFGWRQTGKQFIFV